MRSGSRVYSIRRVLAHIALFSSLALLLGGATGQAVSPRAGEKKTVLPRELVGAWRLAKDDAAPGRKVTPEVITFSEAGTWQVTEAGEPFGGRCRVEGGELVMTLVMGRETQVRRRGFKLDAEGLHFVNAQGGYAHYVRVK
jgi:hypothetical protein